MIAASNSDSNWPSTGDETVGRVVGAKIVIVLEGQASGEIGARLAEISLMDGVLAANLVYEQTMAANGEDDAQQT